ncbi:MAG: hypothetical protein IJ511_03820 [Bacteroides sp.]|nr:hypothetical protein [Bacteroides sp.]
MKKVFLWMGAMLTMLAMAPSCSDDMEMPEQTENSNKQPVMTIIATQGDDAESRLAYNPSADGKQIDMTWTEGDALYVTADDMNFVEFTLTAGAGTNKGTFTPATDATIPSTWVSGTTKLMACYKNDAALLVQQSEMSMLGLMYDNANINAIQTQTANADMNHLLKFNHMQSAIFTYAAGESVNLKFSQMGAIMKFSLSGLGGQTVKSLKLVAGEEVLSMGCVLMYGQWQILYSSIQTLSFGDAGITLGAGETLTAYMMLGATEKTEGKTITLLAETAAGGFYSTTLSGGKLEAGKIYSLNKTMAEHSFFGGGTGTESDPYRLSTAQHLKDLNDWINLEFETEGVYFQLQSDIDLSNECGEGKGNWIPRIGTDGNSFDSNMNPIGFKGTFDGQGHTVKGLYFNDSETEYVGFFGCVAKGGTVKDLHVEGNITADQYSGGVVANNCGTVSGCTFKGTVTTDIYGCGGIVGSNSGTVVGCINYGTVSSSSTNSAYPSYPGGIVGYMGIDGENPGIIACYNVGTVSGTTAGGSIVGEINYATSVSVIGCYDAFNSLNIIGTTNESTVTETANYTSTTTDWATAMTEMNTAINSYGWQYVENTDTDTKTTEPLKLEATGN